MNFIRQGSHAKDFRAMMSTVDQVEFELFTGDGNRFVPPLLRCGAKLADRKIFAKRVEFRRSYSPSLFLLTVKHSYHLRVFSVDTKWYLITYIAGQKLVRGGWIARRLVLLATLISNGKS